jgi:hypothetical protein
MVHNLDALSGGNSIRAAWVSEIDGREVRVTLHVKDVKPNAQISGSIDIAYEIRCPRKGCISSREPFRAGLGEFHKDF